MLSNLLKYEGNIYKPFYGLDNNFQKDRIISKPLKVLLIDSQRNLRYLKQEGSPPLARFIKKFESSFLLNDK